MTRLYSIHEVDWIERRLGALPIATEPLALQHVRSIDTYHAIEQLIDCIADLQEVGLTLREIAGRLTDLGFRISEKTLQSYLQRAVKSIGVPPPQTAAPAKKDDLNPLELDIEVSDEPVVGQSAQTLPAASEDDLNPFELDIEVIDEPVIDHQFEHWFQKG